MTLYLKVSSLKQRISKNKRYPMYEKEISRCHNIQWAKKTSLNSAYGAIGSQYFRFYNVHRQQRLQL